MTDDNQLLDFSDRVRRSVGAYRQAQVYIAFAELEIGPALEHSPLSIDDLAARIDADERSLGRFLDAAAAFGIVVRDGDNISLTDDAFKVFAPGGQQTIGNLLKLEGAFYERWGRLSQAVRSGKRPPENRAQEDRSGWVRMFTLALFDNARLSAPSIAAAIDQAIPPPVEQPLRVIDIGGGHGAYSLALAERRNDVHARVFDLPPVIEITREIIQNSTVRDRVEAVAGDFHVDALGEGWDVALLFGVLHGETPENAVKLLKAIRDALAPGGSLLIRSQGSSRSAQEPGERELFDLHMLLSTEGGSVRTPVDTNQIVEENGFAQKATIDIPGSASGKMLVYTRIE